jgi:molybdopterin molybdotransferase
MITYKEAINKLWTVAEMCPPKIGKISILDSLNRIVANSVIANSNLPSFDNSGLDGFAFRYKDGGSSRFFNSVNKAGDEPLEKPLARGEAVQIMTGAPLPQGADSVIAIEDTRVDGNTVHFQKIPVSGQAVRKKGTDFTQGKNYLTKGTRLEPKHIMALAALGIDKINVFENLKVSLISTGSEIALTTNSDLQPGKIYNSTMPLLKLLAERDGVDFTYSGNIGDDPRAFQKVVEKILLQQPELILTTGAVSMGTEDYVPKIFDKVKIKKLFHRVAIKPGKPIWCGYKGKTFVLGLPGNPLSSYIGWKFFVNPYIRKVYFMPDVSKREVSLLNEVKKPKHLRCFYKANLEENGVRVLEGQESYKISPLLNSNCFAVLPEGKSVFKKSERVEVYDL